MYIAVIVIKITLVQWLLNRVRVYTKISSSWVLSNFMEINVIKCYKIRPYFFFTRLLITWVGAINAFFYNSQIIQRKLPKPSLYSFNLRRHWVHFLNTVYWSKKKYFYEQTFIHLFMIYFVEYVSDFSISHFYMFLLKSYTSY